jgi:O-antigen/teichoic acid export membrane protein
MGSTQNQEDEPSNAAPSGRDATAGQSFGLVGSGVVASLANRFVSLFCGLLITLLSVRMLSLSDYGVLAAGLSAIAVGGAIVVLGLGPAVVREVAASKAAGSETDVARLVNATLTTVLVMGVVAAGGLTYLLVATNASMDRRTLYILTAGLSLLLFGRSVANVSASFARAVGRMTPYAVASSMTNVFQLVAITVLFVAGIGTLTSVGVAYAIVGLVALAIALVFVHRAILSRASRIRLNAREAVRLVILAGPYALAGAALVVIGNLDVLVLSATHPAAEVGLYQPAMRLTTLLLTFVGPMVSTGWAPLATALYVQHRYGEFDVLYRRITKLIILLTGPLFVVLAGAPDTVLSLLLGARFASPASATIVRILLIGFAVNVLCAQNGAALIAAGARRDVGIIYGGGCALMAVLAVVLIPPFGANGAAVTTTVSIVCLNVLVAIALNRRVGTHPLHRDILTVFTTLAIPCVLLVLFGVNHQGTWACLAVAAILSLAWWGVMFATRTVRWAEFKTFIPKRGGREAAPVALEDPEP